MKKLKSSLFTLAMLLCSISVGAHDFEVDGIYYNITDSEKLTVEVTFRGSNYNSYSNEYTGSVVIPESVTYESKTYSVTRIGNSAFCYCSSLTTVAIPNSVTSISNSAFSGCSSLTSVTIPNSVTGIGEAAFSNCGLTSLTIPNSVTSIGSYAFSYCSSLTSINIPDGVTIIGGGAFRFCSSLTSITIPDGVVGIGEITFYGCSSLTSVTIPSSVTNIGDFAFRNCASLESLVVEEGNLFYDSRDNCNAIVKTNTNTILYGCKNTIIPNSITAIAVYAFSSCSGLSTITIPDGVTIIGDFAFDGCCSLTSISIPNSVATIGNSAFNRCSSLISITLPYSLTRIGSSTFYDCSNLTSITIPDGVTSIGGSAFRGCIGLTEITCKAETPPTTTGTSVFDGIDKTIPLYVPKGSVLKYKAAANWRDFVIIREISETKTDVYLTITDCTNGNVKLKVDEDKPYFTLKIEAETGWHVHSVTFNDGDVTAELSSEGEYTTPAIGTDSRLNIVYAQGSSSVNSVSDSKIKVWASGNNIIVDNAILNETINVYTLDGMKITSVNANSNRVEIPLTTGVVYIVKVADKVLKVTL